MPSKLEIKITEQNTLTIEYSKGLGKMMHSFLGNYFAEHQEHLPAGRLHSLVIEEVEKSLFIETLNLCQGNQKKTAELLGINRNTLRKKLLDYQISVISSS